jgi:hypothetical protein
MKVLALAGALLVVALAGGQSIANGAPGAPEVASASVATAPSTPPPPQLPANFNWQGRYIVSDLGVNVSLTWQGRNGYSQMTAGSLGEQIFFTNLIYHGFLYTLTYKWPGIPDNVLGVCHKVQKYTLNDYNAWLATSRFVGTAILGGRSGPQVNHFRASIVWDSQKGLVPPVNALPPVGGIPNVVTPAGGLPSSSTTQPGLALRIPILIADFSVDASDSTKFWQVLHFGFQNVYDPNLDEWITMQKFSDQPGTVALPSECRNATASPPLSVPSP